MDDTTFKALVVSETDGGQFRRDMATRRVADLPEGSLLVRVHYSSLNYEKLARKPTHLEVG